MELTAPTERHSTLPPPPPSAAGAAPTSRVSVAGAPTAAKEGVDLTWDAAADVIAAVRSRSKQEGRSTAADYDRYCHEELTRRGADVAHVAPLAPQAPPCSTVTAEMETMRWEWTTSTLLYQQ